MNAKRSSWASRRICVVAHEQENLSDAFAVHLSALHPKSAAALIGGVAYGLILVPGSIADAEERASRIAQEFLDRVGDQHSAVIGLGPPASDVAALALSRSCVDRVLRVLRERLGGQRVARLADIQLHALMFEMRDIMAARGDRPEGALARLMAYDALHHTNLVETLHTWLETFGDVVAAAVGLYVHPNTFRYRLRRCAPLLPATLDIMKDWITDRAACSDSEPLFATTTGRPLSRDAIEARIRHATARAAEACPSLAGKNVTAHTLRHTAAMRLLYAGVDTTVIALWLGHEQVTTTNIYIHADMTIKEQAIARIAPLSTTTRPTRYKPTDAVMAFLDHL